MSGAAALILCFLGPHGAPGAEAKPRASMGFTELVKETRALAGTVGRSWIDTDRTVHERVVRVALTNVTSDAHASLDRLLVTLWSPRRESGSPLGGRSPYRRGERYIFLLSVVRGEETGGTALVAVNRGQFPILYDRSQRRAVVHDAWRRPLARIEEDRLVVVDAPQSGSAPAVAIGSAAAGPRLEVLSAAEDPGTRVFEETFLGEFRRIRTQRDPRSPSRR